MKIKCAIVEDQSSDQEALKNALLSYGKEKDYTFSIDCFSSPLQFQEKDRGEYDILFFDIEMPGMNGLELAKRLRQRNQDVILFFVTNLAKFAINGYDYNAYSYLLKPVNQELLKLKLDGLNSLLQKKKKEYKLTLKNKDGVFLIDIKDIYYIEVQDHRVVYHTSKGEFSLFASMKEVLKNLENKGFSLASQSYLINLEKVTEIRKESVVVNEEEVFFSRARKKPFLEDFNRFVSENI